MKRYTISVDLYEAGILAEDSEEALKIAKSEIEAGCYSLQVCDVEEI